MLLALLIAAWMCLVLAAAGLVYYSVVLFRIVSASRRYPTLRDGLELAAGRETWPRLCVIIPAHNERDVIETVITSLLRQDYPSLRIVLVLDRCTDDTRQVAELAARGASAELDSRLEIVEVHECPEPWAGKTHALWNGVIASNGAVDSERLLFTDADCAFAQGCLRASVALQDGLDVDLLSALSTLTADRWYERIVQPAAGFELVRQYPLDLVNRRESPRPFANGQFMLWKRDSYDKLGGHERIKRALLEDIAMARLLPLKEYDLRGNVLMSDGMLTCRMYRTWDAFQRGWRRIYTEAVTRKPARLSKAAWRLVLTGAILPSAMLAGAGLGGTLLATGQVDRMLGAILTAISGSGLFIMLVSLVLIYKAQGASRTMVLFYPLGAMAVARILRGAAKALHAGELTQWGGKTYVRKVRT